MSKQLFKKLNTAYGHKKESNAADIIEGITTSILGSLLVLHLLKLFVV